MRVPDIEISFQNFEFHKRAWWMLSSILQQRPHGEHGVPRLGVVMSVHRDDAHPDMLGALIETFGNPGFLRVERYTGDGYFYRGQTRNTDIQNSQAKWILFSDSDMLFHPDFFSRLWSEVIPGHTGSGTLLTAPRHNMDTGEAYRLADGEPYGRRPIAGAFDRCWEHRVGYSGRGRAPGAGYFQLVERSHLIEAGIEYSSPTADRPISAEKGNKFFSDIRFRRKLNGVVALKRPPDANGMRDVLPPILHMNHLRKRDAGWAAACR